MGLGQSSRGFPYLEIQSRKKTPKATNNPTKNPKILYQRDNRRGRKESFKMLEMHFSRVAEHSNKMKTETCNNNMIGTGDLSITISLRLSK